MDVTAKFQGSIPYTLHSASPALAALHTRRTRKLSTTPTDPDSETYCCAKCGFYLFAGDSSTRVVRVVKNNRRQRTDAPTCTSNSNSRTRARQSTCLQCGWVNELSLDREPASLFPIRRSSLYSKTGDVEQPSIVAVKSIQKPKDAPVESRALSSRSNVQSTSSQLPPESSVPPASTPVIAKKSKSRPKKKNGLHEMLAQNRAKEEKTKNALNGGQSSLAAFLESL
ncbi:hypothetical protein DFJ43DRAFT_1051413 [Lentinula guzmanii]|uniref:Rpr2-domain-containing protein n=1 Tax=Lentinula guzmanii TaxID=2804957 RepID=A0AA38JQ75_9AGAR|nr:hypothetical protein DFJ43DRAFT_1051413 [Lentinula guzmanii]